MSLAKKMIRQAASVGADIVKFQSYFGKDFKDSDPEKEWFTKVEISNEEHFMLKDFSRAQGVEFLSSPFSLERAEFLCRDLGLKAIKIASGMMLSFPDVTIARRSILHHYSSMSVKSQPGSVLTALTLSIWMDMTVFIIVIRSRKQWY